MVKKQEVYEKKLAEIVKSVTEIKKFYETCIWNP